MQDLELIDLFNEGDEEAFEELVIRYEIKIYSACFYFLKNKEDAEDAAQDVIIKLYRKLHTFRKEAAFSTWLNYVTANTCRDILRKKKRNTVIHLDADIQTEKGQIKRELPSGEPGPQDLIEGKELSTLVIGALFLLSEDHRNVLLMREYQSLTYEEIAEILEISLGTVKSRLYRARKELKEHLDASEHMAEYVRQKDNQERS